ncbi:MAG TPA: hypothetical protein VNH11_26010 [Pirellulales bacterium]|nr:hypothetical protein [Pirellulales bacterium]
MQTSSQCKPSAWRRHAIKWALVFASFAVFPETQKLSAEEPSKSRATRVGGAAPRFNGGEIRIKFTAASVKLSDWAQVHEALKLTAPRERNRKNRDVIRELLSGKLLMAAQTTTLGLPTTGNAYLSETHDAGWLAGDAETQGGREVDIRLIPGDDAAIRVAFTYRRTNGSREAQRAYEVSAIADLRPDDIYVIPAPPNPNAPDRELILIGVKLLPPTTPAAVKGSVPAPRRKR